MSTTSTPKFIPSAEELSKTQRDLRFHPSTVENPKTLTPIKSRRSTRTAI